MPRKNLHIIPRLGDLIQNSPQTEQLLARDDRIQANILEHLRDDRRLDVRAQDLAGVGDVVVRGDGGSRLLLLRDVHGRRGVGVPVGRGGERRRHGGVLGPVGVWGHGGGGRAVGGRDHGAVCAMPADGVSGATG